MRIYSQKNKGGIIWGIDCKNPITGKRFMQIIGTKKQAEDSLAKHRQETVLYKAYGKKEYFEMQNSVVEDITFSDYDKIYLEHAYANKKSADRDARSIKALSDYVVDQEKNIRFGDLKLSSITQKMIEDYKVYRLKQVKSVCLNSVIQEYVKPSTVNREISCLKHMLELAVDWKYLFINPAKKVKEFDEDDSYVRYLELNEVGPLINACGTLKRAVYLKPIVVIALNSGMRKTEILCLKQKDIDFKKGLIYISMSKNGEGAYQQINSDGLNALKEFNPNLLSADKDHSEEYVFKNRDGKRLKDVRTAFKKALKIAGVSDFRFHDLRHTYASHLVMKGVDLTTVKDLMRHKTIAMTLRYAHLSPEHKMKAIEGLYGINCARNPQDLNNK